LKSSDKNSTGSRKSKAAKAIDEAQPPEVAGSPEQVRSSGPEWLRRRFKLLENGLHVSKDDNLFWISAYIRIEAETIDEHGNWGLLIGWRDRNGSPRSEIFPREQFSGDCREVRNRLAAGGLTMAADARSRVAFGEFLNLAGADQRARCVSRTGWHKISGARVFVLPDQVIGDSKERVIAPNAGREGTIFGSAGTLDGWRKAVSSYACGNSRLIFSISAAFAGSLLDISGEDGGGFNLKGASRVGKTTALRVAASVWGGDSEQGASSFIRSWRATGNGLEGVAAQFCDTLLALDEMGQVDGAEIGDIAYMLSNGSGKSRAGRDGGSRTPAKWRILFLSTGELGLADKNAEAKKSTRAGQEVRLIDIKADAEIGYGLFEQIHDSDSADEFADILRAGGRVQFGTAGRAFVAWIIEQIASNPEFEDRIRQDIEATVTAWLRKVQKAGGQVRSVARRFALVAIGGELATLAGITGWERGDSIGASRRLFESWLYDRGTLGSSEDKRAIDQLSAFISRHGSARFEVWQSRGDDPSSELYETEESQPTEKFRPMHRAGWRKYVANQGLGQWNYYVTDEAMVEALAGLDMASSIKALAEAGFIIRDPERKTKTKVRPPGIGKAIRLYVVPSDVIGASISYAAD
jgi:uncharacterized protein (DUF927 family)